MNAVENANVESKMPAESIRVYINGEIHRIPCAQTVATLLAGLKIPAERVAIELNQTIVRKREWENTLVSDGARIEIVEFVGGG
jgi:sulfur carrier protein